MGVLCWRCKIHFRQINDILLILRHVATVSGGADKQHPCLQCIYDAAVLQCQCVVHVYRGYHEPVIRLVQNSLVLLSGGIEIFITSSEMVFRET